MTTSSSSSNSHNKESVTFSDNSIIPGSILVEAYGPLPPEQITAWDEDAIFQSFQTDLLTLKRATLMIQRFLRLNLKHLRRFNNEKSRLSEEMDNVTVIKAGELERVEDFRAGMKREAAIEMALEIDTYMEGTNVDSLEWNDLMVHVEEDKRTVKSLEAEIANLKQQSETLTVENKRLALDTFSLYELFTQAVSDIKGVESEKIRLKYIESQFAHCVGKLERLLKTADHDIAHETRKRTETNSRIDSIITTIEERCNKRKLVKRLLRIKRSVASSEETTEAPEATQ